jgi:two-component system, NtrC family, response regulator AtoC
MNVSPKHRGTVLVVDDDHDIVETLCDILELRGWGTLRAYDGLEAVAIALKESVDWIVMDVRMPRLTGVDALHQIREMMPNARVVLMTAYASPDLTARAHSEGVATVLLKPFDPRELFRVIEKAA